MQAPDIVCEIELDALVAQLSKLSAEATKTSRSRAYVLVAVVDTSGERDGRVADRAE